MINKKESYSIDKRVNLQHEQEIKGDCCIQLTLSSRKNN